MEASSARKSRHKEWRRIAKRERRRRLRRQAAAQRDADEERLQAALESSAEYSDWLRQQELLEQEKEEREKANHDLLEKLWLEEETRAQKEWHVLQERKQKARQQQLEQEAKIRAEFEEKQEAIRKKQEEERRKREEETEKHARLLKEIEDYIDHGIKTPETLREIIDSQPGKELCPFFTKTGACKYGNTCSRNHQRVCLSKVILIPGFYSHFSLEKNTAEYDTDVSLEFDSSETHRHFYEFYKDVVSELESYGNIKTFKCCRNAEVHLRGNLYVEYYTEREAARAVRSLKGRWYAGRRLNCDFCNLKSWRSAVCGTSKCPKGRACNFLHTFRNPNNDYDIKSPPRWAKQTGTQEVGSSRRSEHSSRSKSKWEEVTGEDIAEKRNWRWSESPEPESKTSASYGDKDRYHSSERGHSHKTARDNKHHRSERSRENSEPSSDRQRSRSKKYLDETVKDDEPKNGRHSSRTRSPRSRRAREDDYERPSRRTNRNYSNGQRDRSSRSRSERYSGRKETRRSKDHETEKYKSRKRSDPSRIDEEERTDQRSKVKVTRSKSKWDKEQHESSSSESSTSPDSSPTRDVEDVIERKSDPVSVIPKESKDEWATTDSESNGNDQSPT